jgi:hypothetical protein
MDSTRRQFVATSVVGLPALLCSSDAKGLMVGQPSAADPVLGQIEMDVVRAYTEIRENPRRIDSLRSFEGSLRVHAAYAIGAGLDAAFKNSLARSVKTRGKAEWIDDLTTDVHARHRGLAELRKRHPGLQFDARLDTFEPIAREEAEKVVNRLLKDGVSSSLVAAANEIQKYRERIAAAQPQGIVHVAARENPCDHMSEVSRWLGIMVASVCGLSMMIPALAPECFVLSLEWAAADAIAWACELMA